MWMQTSSLGRLYTIFFIFLMKSMNEKCKDHYKKANRSWLCPLWRYWFPDNSPHSILREYSGAKNTYTVYVICCFSKSNNRSLNVSKLFYWSETIPDTPSLILMLQTHTPNPHFRSPIPLPPPPHPWMSSRFINIRNNRKLSGKLA